VRPLSLDFVREPQASPVGYLLLAAGLLAAGLVLFAHLGLTGQVERYKELAASVAGPRTGQARALPVAVKSEQEALTQARQVVDHLAVPWGRLFAALEQIDEKDVALLTIAPEVQKRQIRVYAEAKNLAAMLSYHKRLEDDPVFSVVSLTEHEVQVRDPQQPVRFNITATWR